ncbi:Zn-ribbon domain-containing OB-fold protein [Acrocarpospora catenulata]|uniref:Zn-ribbon domain-containing OB-fold protein n=1 Tax=Acrocarpospora catenulata TaxID=2836182 RepID=UPI001BDA3E7F|nr:OB-fold domain-containing protein [Acrocarpospora catenulata]
MKPLPLPTPDTAAFFAAIDAGELKVPRCSACGRFFLYPRAYCPFCTSDQVTLEPASGRGSLESYVVNHRPAPGFEEDAPYVLGVVRLAEGPTLFAEIAGDPVVDGDLEAFFEPRSDRNVLKFRMRKAAG